MISRRKMRNDKPVPSHKVNTNQDTEAFEIGSHITKVVN